MLDSLQTSTLLSSSLSSSSNKTLAGLFSNDEVTLATVTKNLLDAHFNIEQPTSSVVFSDELISFINDNLDSEEAEALLADIAAIEQLSSLGSNSSSSANSLLGSEGTGDILDLLI